MLLLNIIPLDFAVKAVSKDFFELGNRITHCRQDVLFPFVSVLPEICEQGTRHTGTADNQAFIVFVQHLEVHTWISVEVLWAVAV